MDIKYNVTKLRENKTDEVKDHISVEEPLEMNLLFKQNSDWHTENLSITMRTPGNDEDLVTGFLFNERIIEDVNQIIKIEKQGDQVGDYNIQNKIEATIDNIKNIDIGKLKVKHLKKILMSKNILDKNLYIDRENLEKIIEPSLKNYNNHIVDLILSVHNNESKILDFGAGSITLVISS